MCTSLALLIDHYLTHRPDCVTGNRLGSHTVTSLTTTTHHGPSTTNFLEREKAILGDNVDQFATIEDASFIKDANDDVPGGDILWDNNNKQYLN